MKIAVLGGGSWGTALALLLLNNGHQVSLWSYSESDAKALLDKRENRRLPGILLPEELEITCDPKCVIGKDILVIATPSYAVRKTSEMLRDLVGDNTVIVSASKGIERESSLRLSQVIEQVTGRTVAVLSGPSHAEEVSRGVPTGCVAASRERWAAELVQDAFMNQQFRVYASPDVVGVELGAALKNIIALAAGVCDGMGCGDNTKALLMTRGMTEIARLGVALGGHKETFAGLAGVGDLIVTCTSMHSRNRRAGILIGQGNSPEQALREVGAVVESYYATRSAKELADKVGIEMPITEQAYQVLYEGKRPSLVVEQLMTREKKHEIESSWV